jgi:PLP dependent protein
VAVSIAQGLAQVQARIERACRAAGRDPSSVRLLAVSKFHSASAIREAYAFGQRDFGENYAQELADKAHQLGDLPDLRFRFIGGLQRNKLKLLAPLGCAIETLASASSAQTLAERARPLAMQVEVMVQVNVAGEAQKSGLDPSALSEMVAFVRTLPELRLTGLMTIPKADDLEQARRCYARLRQLAEQHQLTELSMGMSDDLEVAIAEGATWVRVGTAIFGARAR